MSYQDEEVLPMLNNSKDSPKKKHSSGLAALMVLCLAGTSYLAGRSYGYSSAAASVLGLGDCFEIRSWDTQLIRPTCGGPQASKCVYNAIQKTDIYDVPGDPNDIMTCNFLPTALDVCDDILKGMKINCIDNPTRPY